MSSEESPTLLHRRWSDVYLQNKRIGAFCYGCDILTHLIRILRESTELEALYLMCDVHTMGKAFVNALSSNSTLKSLIIFGGCGEGGIGSKGAHRLAAALKLNTSIEYLCLDANSIGDEGAKYIGRALGQSESIRGISLRHNNICSNGAKALGSSLDDRGTLMYLDLSCNRIADSGAIGLCDTVMGDGREVRCKVDVSHNQIHEEGGNRLYQSLESNSEICIEWEGNCFSDELEKKIWNLHQRLDASLSNYAVAATLKELGVANKDEEICIMQNVQAMMESDDDLFGMDGGWPDNNESETETSSESSGGPPTKRARTEADPENSNGSSSAEGNDSEGSDLESKRQSTDSNKSEESGANDTLEGCKQKLVFTYDWQEKFEELATLAETGPVGKEAIAKIRNRV